MKKIVLIGVAVAAALAIAATVHMVTYDRGKLTTVAEFEGLARTVTGNELASETDPAILMRFDSSFRHLGGQKFVLYGVADVEQHFFVETTADDQLRSVYWIQFEAYRPDNRYSYDYEDSSGRLQLGDYDFYVDTEPVEVDADRKRRRGTDGARAREFLDSHGFRLPANFNYARLVHLTDASRRKELMVIFIDDLAPLGLTGSQLAEGGDARERWPQIEQDMLEKIRRTMTLAVPNQ